MAKIVLEIEKCDECPFIAIVPHPTEDSWEHGEDYICRKSKKTVGAFVEWPSEIPKVPWDCPLRSD